MADIAELDHLHAIADHLRFVEGPGGLPVAELRTPAASARVSLQGGQVLDYRVGDGEPVLWTSPGAVFEPGRPVRGGVPLCWPWFGADPAGRGANHGFARTRPWRVIEAARLMDGRGVCLCLGLADDAETRELWPQTFDVQAWITLDRRLTVELLTLATDPLPTTLSAALHAYFRVGDVGRVSVEGLDGSEFLDKNAGLAEARQSGALRVEGAMDRIYTAPGQRVTLEDPVLGRRIGIERLGGDSLVAWNPGAEGVAKIGDMPAGAEREMLCLEPALGAVEPVTLAPGEEARFGMVISSESAE